MSWLARITIVCVIALVGTGCGGDSDGGGDSGGSRVGVVIKGLVNPFFVAMKQGVEAAADERDADVSIKAAHGLLDTAGQAAELEALIAEGMDCYVVNPIDASNLVTPLSHLPEGTPIVNIDSPIGADAAQGLGIDIRTYIGTDNNAAGRLAADAMAPRVDRGATVGVIGGTSGDATSAARIDGFTARAAGRFTPLDTVSADWSEQKAMLSAAALLRSRPGITGFFAANDQMALGIAQAVDDAGRSGDVAIVGVDGIKPALDAVQRGEMSATVSQYPYTIGKLGVEACLAAAGGESLPAQVDAPIQVITEQNVEQAQSKFPEPVEPFESPFAALLGE